MSNLNPGVPFIRLRLVKLRVFEVSNGAEVEMSMVPLLTKLVKTENVRIRK